MILILFYVSKVQAYKIGKSNCCDGNHSKWPKAKIRIDIALNNMFNVYRNMLVDVLSVQQVYSLMHHATPPNQNQIDNEYIYMSCLRMHCVGDND